MFSFFKHLFHNPDYKSEQNESTTSQSTELKSESKINQEDQESDLNSEQSDYPSIHESDLKPEINGDFVFLKSDKNAEEKVRKIQGVLNEYDQWVDRQAENMFESIKPLILFQVNVPREISVERSIKEWFKRNYGKYFEGCFTDCSSEYSRLMNSIDLNKIVVVETLYTVNKYVEGRSLEIKNQHEINRVERQLYEILKSDIGRSLINPMYCNIDYLEVVLEDRLVNLIKKNLPAYNLGQISQSNSVILIFPDYKSEKRFVEAIDSFNLTKNQKDENRSNHQVSDQKSENKILTLHDPDFNSEKNDNDKYSWKKFDQDYWNLIYQDYNKDRILKKLDKITAEYKAENKSDDKLIRMDCSDLNTEKRID